MHTIVCVAGVNNDSPYTYVNGVLRDGDGDEIKLLDPRNGSTAASTSAVASPQIHAPVLRKRSVNTTPAFLCRNKKKNSTAASTSAVASPKIHTPVLRKRSANITPAFLCRNLRFGTTVSPVPHKRTTESPVPHKRNRTDSRRKRPRRSLQLRTTTYRFPVRTRSTIASTKRLKAQLSQLHESILFEETRRKGPHATTAVKRTMTRMKAIEVFVSNNISLECAYTVAFTGHFISSDVLMYGLELWCPRQYIPFHYLGSPQAHSFCFNAVGQHEDAAQQVALMQRRCVRYQEVIESGLCLVLPYNYPVNMHWMCVLAWKDTTNTNPAGYVLQPRNSMRSCRRHDKICVRDAKTFLKHLYEYAGTPTHELPKWTAVPTPNNVCEQARGEMSCCIHTLAQAILAFNGTWRSQSFSESFVHSIRLHLLDHMASEGVRVLVTTRPNIATVAVGLIHGINLRRKYFMQVLRLEKTKECRLQYKTYLKYKIGDVIKFRCGNQYVDRKVVAIRLYRNLESMFASETVKAFLPHLSESDVDKAVSEYMSFFNRADLHLGVIIFHLSPQNSKESPENKVTIQKQKFGSGQVRKKTDLFNRLDV